MTRVSYVRQTSVESENKPDSSYMGQERAKVEAEAVHVAQGYSPGAPCLRLLVHSPFPVKLVNTHVVLITKKAH